MTKWASGCRTPLDALEYANGPTDSFWGGLPRKNGHRPFNLKFMEIGNENGTQATTNAGRCSTKRSKPNIPTCSSSPMNGRAASPKDPCPISSMRTLLQRRNFFMQQAHYDDYDRKGPKIFVGEYAVCNTGKAATCGSHRGRLS